MNPQHISAFEAASFQYGSESDCCTRRREARLEPVRRTMSLGYRQHDAPAAGREYEICADPHRGAGPINPNAKQSRLCQCGHQIFIFEGRVVSPTGDCQSRWPTRSVLSDRCLHLETKVTAPGSQHELRLCRLFCGDGYDRHDTVAA